MEFYSLMCPQIDWAFNRQQTTGTTQRLPARMKVRYNLTSSSASPPSSCSTTTGGGGRGVGRCIFLGLGTNYLFLRWDQLFFCLGDFLRFSCSFLWDSSFYFTFEHKCSSFMTSWAECVLVKFWSNNRQHTADTIQCMPARWLWDTIPPPVLRLRPPAAVQLSGDEAEGCGGVSMP